MPRKRKADPKRVMFRWTVAGAVALLVLLALGEFLVDHPDLVKHERATMPPLIEVVPN